MSRPGAVAVCAFGLFYLGDILIHLPGASHRGDFSAYYLSGLAIRLGLNPYAVSLNRLAGQFGFTPLPFDHPADTPTMNLAFALLSWLRPESAYRVWFGIELAALFGALAIMFRSTGRQGRGVEIALGVFALAFTPLADNFRWAQSQTIVLLGLAMVFAFVREGRDAPAGIALGVLGLLRVYPLVMGGYLLARGRWRSLAWMAATIAAGGAATAAIVGTDALRNYIGVLGLAGGSQWLSLDPRLYFGGANFSLSAFIARPIEAIFGDGAAARAAIFHRGFIAMADVAIVACAFRATRAGDDDDGRAFSLWVVTMLILSPIVWAHYLAVLLLPFAQIALAALNGRVTAGTWSWAMTSWCAIVLATPIMADFALAFSYADWRVAALSEAGFIGLFAAWIAAWRFATETSSGRAAQ
ncbi:MAG TPA: glycosyltransferase family 87 protein [Candidatus Binataceae bacterium]|nr:glycosyltransferase family 87 protein [Candidatus Binataceae bacterium]